MSPRGNEGGPRRGEARSPGREAGAPRAAAPRRGDATAGASPGNRRARRSLLTWADRVVLYALVGLGAAFLVLPAGSGEPRLVRIEGAAGFERTVPLDRDAEIEVPGPLGTSVVRVESGAVRVVSSPCRQQICVGMGAARKPGAVIVCVPNEVVVRVLGDAGEGHDALTR